LTQLVAKSALRIDRLKALREARGWSQRELALRCGLGDSQINKYETGMHDPSASYLKLIAEQLEVSTDYLLGLSDHPHSSGQESLSSTENKLVEAYTFGDTATLLELIAARVRQMAAPHPDG
jgi:transcriptional regulator with XRE-family HTH domain